MIRRRQSHAICKLIMNHHITPKGLVSI